MFNLNGIYFKYEVKAKIIEIIKFDYQFLKFPFSALYLCIFVFHYANKQHLAAVEALSKLYRSGWAGSKSTVIYIITKLFGESNTEFKQLFLEQLTEQVVALENTKHFFEDPRELFVGVCIVLSPRTSSKKGILLVKYSYYFPLMFKLFDMQNIADNYHIVLEPSWAGTCEPGILAYATLNSPVFIMSYETRDTDFLKGISTNLNDVKLSSNWWVDHRKFNYAMDIKRDIDIIVISTWANFKRHYFIFKALVELKKVLPDLSVALVGYPGDLSLQDVKQMAENMGLADVVNFHEWLPPEEVSQLLQRSKVNLLWSRFEGLNRSIIEGMFCNVPCILREGFNYGDKYPYINAETGRYSSESKLADNLNVMLKNYENYSPRSYVLNNHTCIKATQILREKINVVEREVGNELTNDIAVKINALHGMDYFEADERSNYHNDEAYIISQLKLNTSQK
jgi:glycosyltransferase involved in cell wall biosynthesis